MDYAKYYKGRWSTNYVKSQCAVPFGHYITKTVDKCNTILEIGCGDGTTVGILRDAGYSIIGMDITDAGFKDRPYCRTGNVLAIPFDDDSFDVVISTDVLEHIEHDDIDQAIKEIYRVARSYTFHIIPAIPCSDKDERGRDIHLICEYPEWWIAKFKEHNNKGIKTCIINRDDFLGGSYDRCRYC